jgi:REP element-mobilizing transposase RayT
MGNLRRFLLDGYCYHVITATRGRRPILRLQRNAEIVAGAIQFIRTRALVLAFVVMPDHVHVLLVPRQNESLPRIMQGLKGYSARAINEVSRTRAAVWQQSYYDRVIRDERQLRDAIEYIHRNPVEARLVALESEYRFSSARPGVSTDLVEFLGA